MSKSKVAMVNRFWCETPETVREELDKKFPNLKEHFNIEKGVLSYLVHPRDEYRIGFVFSLTNEDGIKQTVIYYPIKRIFVRLMNQVVHFPIRVEPRSFTTKRGLMRVVDCNGEKVITFYRIYTKVIEVR